MTREVPPLLKTELLSVPSVTLGAITLVWAVPSAATVKTKLGMSPAGKPVGPCSPWLAPVGLKWGPADLKSGGSHFANWRMCIRCAPGGRFLISNLIFTPCVQSESTGVPTLLPCAFMMSTVTGFDVARFWPSCAKTAAPKSTKKNTALAMALTMFLHPSAQISGTRRRGSLSLYSRHLLWAIRCDFCAIRRVNFGLACALATKITRGRHELLTGIYDWELDCFAVTVGD